MPLDQNLIDFAQRSGNESKALRTLINGNTADLAQLATTDKTTLVNALNEVAASVATAAGIDDATTSGTTTWSSDKTSTEIAAARAGAVADVIDDDAPTATSTTLSATAIAAAVANAKSEIIGGAGDAYDTLVEIQNLLQASDSTLGGLTDALANRVRFDEAQSLTGAQQSTARSNIGAVSAAAVGNTDVDLVGTFTAALSA